MAESLTSRSTYSSSLRSHSAWWLLARHSDSQKEVLTLTHGGSEVLPVFSFREEAEMYLLMERLGSDYRSKRRLRVVPICVSPLEGGSNPSPPTPSRAASRDRMVRHLTSPLTLSMRLDLYPPGYYHGCSRSSFWSCLSGNGPEGTG